MEKHSISNKAIHILALVLLLMLFVSGGCIIPFPHVKKTCDPLCGNVVDSDANHPIKNATIEIRYPDGGCRKTNTNEYGSFYFSKKTRFHWGILFGVALNHSLPFDCYHEGFTFLKVDAEGYETLLVYPKYVRNVCDKPERMDILFLEYPYADCHDIGLFKGDVSINK